MISKKIKKVVLQAGFDLKVKLQEMKNGKVIKEYWYDVRQRFGSRREASVFAAKNFPKAKAHIDRLRLDITPHEIKTRGSNEKTH